MIELLPEQKAFRALGYNHEFAVLTIVKRLYSTSKWKSHSRRRAADQLKACRRRREYLRRLRVPGEHPNDRPRKNFKKTFSIKAPEHFSAVENPAEFVRFLNLIRSIGTEQNLFFDLRHVRVLTPDGIAAFLATTHHRSIERARISGNLPANKGLQDVLTHSGFYEYMTRKGIPATGSRLGVIKTRKKSREATDEKLNQDFAIGLIEFAMTKLTGKAASHSPSYCVITEAMLNTVHHASRDDDATEPWWASVYWDAARKRACFTFIDHGVGVFKSNKLNLRLRAAKDLFTRVKLPDNGALLRMVMHDEIPSSTDELGRGYGIPIMYNRCRYGLIRNFTILSNDAIGNAELESYSAFPADFEGTLLYWEIEA